MQNVLVPGAVVLLTVVLWLRRKPVKPMLSSTDTRSKRTPDALKSRPFVDTSTPTCPDDPAVLLHTSVSLLSSCARTTVLLKRHCR